MNRRALLNAALIAPFGTLIYGCAGSATSESTGEYIDDSVITAKVKTEIAQELGLGATTEIGVETFKGVVQLSGFVEDESTRANAGRIAWTVDGVKDVQNQIALK